MNPNTQQGSIKNKTPYYNYFGFYITYNFVLQYSLNNQQEMIKENKSHLIRNNKIIFCKKDGHSLNKDVKALTSSEEEILKFARKLYGFSKPNETIFQITE